MKKFTALLVLVTILALSGCECLSGLGRDVQKAGRWMEKQAEEAR